MDVELDALAAALLKKSADSSGFLCEEADRALSAMTAHCSESRVLVALLGTSGHRSAQIRAKTAYFLDRLVTQMGPRLSQASAARDVERVVLSAVKFLGEGSADSRAAAKRTLHTLWRVGAVDERTLRRILPDTHYTRVREVLEKGPPSLSASTGEGAADGSDIGNVTVGAHGATGGSFLAEQHDAGPGSVAHSSTRRSGLGGASPVRARPARPDASAATADAELDAALPGILALLGGGGGSGGSAGGNDWRSRSDAATSLSLLVCRYPHEVSSSAQRLVSVVDAYAAGVSDANTKVGARKKIVGVVASY
jgi:hypothetical protein